VAKPSADAGQELAETERLDHVVVGPCLEVRHPVAHRVLGGQHDHRQCGARGAEPPENLFSGQTGQSEIEDDEVNIVLLRGKQSPMPVRFDRDGEAGGLQAPAQKVGDAGLIFDHQYGHRLPAPIPSRVQPAPSIDLRISADHLDSECSQETDTAT